MLVSNFRVDVFTNFIKNVTLIVRISNLMMVYCKASQEPLFNVGISQ